MVSLRSFQCPASADEQDVHGQAAVGAAELGTIARHLQIHPEMALDFTEVSGEHCLNTWKAGGAQMMRFAVDTSTTSEDVVEFVKADSLASLGSISRPCPGGQRSSAR